MMSTTNGHANAPRAWPSDLARPGWLDLASIGSIWPPWAPWLPRFVCPGRSWASWLAQFACLGRPDSPWLARFGCSERPGLPRFAGSGCPEQLCSRCLARFECQRKPRRLAFRLPASRRLEHSVCIVSSCFVSSIYIHISIMKLPNDV